LVKNVPGNPTGHEYVIPTHQGRGAEQILFPQLVPKPGMYVVGNGHFDTTTAWIRNCGAKPVDMVTEEALNVSSTYPFKGEENPSVISVCSAKHKFLNTNYFPMKFF